MLSLLAAFLRIASRLACLIVIVSFAIFVVEQTSNASNTQQNKLAGTGSGSAPSTSPSTHSHKSTLHKAIDEVAAELTSPFSGITAGDSSQWVIRGVGTLLALLVYGLGIGYLTRLMHLRV
jgi:hypothetical protein